jgi:hypothetical protein
MMKKVLTLVVIIALLPLAIPAFAQEMPHECLHDGATIASLRGCVEHGVMMGHIDNNGVANSLFAKLDAAEAALDRGQTDTATNILIALVNSVSAQAGKHIVSHHAEHMLLHIQDVIDALSA